MVYLLTVSELAPLLPLTSSTNTPCVPTQYRYVSPMLSPQLSLYLKPGKDYSSQSADSNHLASPRTTDVSTCRSGIFQ